MEMHSKVLWFVGSRPKWLQWSVLVHIEFTLNGAWDSIGISPWVVHTKCLSCLLLFSKEYYEGTWSEAQQPGLWLTLTRASALPQWLTSVCGLMANVAKENPHKSSHVILSPWWSEEIVEKSKKQPECLHCSLQLAWAAAGNPVLSVFWLLRHFVFQSHLQALRVLPLLQHSQLHCYKYDANIPLDVWKIAHAVLFSPISSCIAIT